MKDETYRKRLLTKSISQLKQIADELCSEYIRRKYSDWQGNVSCYTCGKVKRWQEQQCGHYISRTYNNTRYYEPNLRVQCYSCNVEKRGNYTEFAIRLEREKAGTLEHLDMWKHRKSTDSTRMELIELIFDFKKKLSHLTNL